MTATLLGGSAAFHLFAAGSEWEDCKRTADDELKTLRTLGKNPARFSTRNSPTLVDQIELTVIGSIAVRSASETHGAADSQKLNSRLDAYHEIAHLAAC